MHSTIDGLPYIPSEHILEDAGVVLALVTAAHGWVVELEATGHREPE